MSSRRIGAIGLALIAALLLFVPVRSRAAAFGSVSGTVADAQSKAVPGACVRLESTASDAVLMTRTDAQGRFNFANVELGTYRLSVLRQGFITSTQPVTVESGYFPSPHILLVRS
ncbi:MAG TPA: carboxypeptidase-like regulatory domain-containing protein, partial [Steroidobacteraceae bacterium]|nr:carboxypeptidase-like regulatory domain-containing protein [Steroidobacteraceae bacterium]